ncbi:hypothetical protein K3495_g12202 [Podosphaera aphanis]|nr:hypothetical protein K3495_g12202 [Podosphaera aphanis]
MALSTWFGRTMRIVIHPSFRFIQLVLAITVCATYGVDLDQNTKTHTSPNGKWIFAEVTAGLAALSAMLYPIPFVFRLPFIFIWDLLILILWVTLFALFGAIYFRKSAAQEIHYQRMRNAVWIDLANVVCWLISTIGMGIYWATRNRRSTFTGRATI